MSVTLTIVSLQEQYTHLEEDIIKDGEMLTTILSDNIRLGIFAGDKGKIAEVLKSTVRVDGVIGACAFNIDGQLLHRENNRGWDQISICVKDDTVSTDFFGPIKKSNEVVHFDNARVVKFFGRVFAQPQQFTDETLYFNGEEGSRSARLHHIGYVGLVFDKEPIQKKIRQILIKSCLILVFFLSIGSIAAYYIIQGVTRPLNRLIAKIKSYGHNVNPRDELGMLNETFSGMIETVSNSIETINELKIGLENKVDELQSEIHRRRKTEKALRDSEEKFRGISEGIADGVAIVVQGKFTWFNKAFCTIFGCNFEEMLGREAEILLPAPEQKPDSLWLQDSITGTETQTRFVVETQQKNKQKILVEVNARKIVFENQDAIEVIIRDITEVDQAEKKKKRLELKALTHSKMADLGKIASSVAHEVNQPLSYIKIACESSLRDIENQQFDQEESREYFAEALRQVDRITLITEHLRSFGRTDTSLFSEVWMPDVLVSSLILMGEALRLAEIVLIREIDENLPPVTGNSVQLEQVFINLFQNSIDAMAESDEKKIMVTMRSTGVVIEISFSDTGPGIQPEMQESIFEPFITTKKLEDRSGLGLAIIKNIIKEHKGTIEYRQEPDRGAKFVIVLPVCE